MRTAEECAIAEIRAAKDANRLVPRGNSHVFHTNHELLWDLWCGITYMSLGIKETST